MFGYNSVKKQKKQLKKDRSAFNQEKSSYDTQRNDVNRQTEEAKIARDKARQEGRTYAEDVLSRDVQGLTPQQRSSMQYEANKQIQRGVQSADRKLLGEQSRRGIVGQGGVGYAQRKDLHRMGQEAMGQSQRDLERLNSDLALKKMAAMFNIEQGEASQNALDRQAAQDEIRYGEEKKRQRGWEDKFNKIFSRV